MVNNDEREESKTRESRDNPTLWEGEIEWGEKRSAMVPLESIKKRDEAKEERKQENILLAFEKDH